MAVIVVGGIGDGRSCIEFLLGPSHHTTPQLHLCCNFTPKCAIYVAYDKSDNLLDFHPTLLVEIVKVITFSQYLALTCKYKPTEKWISEIPEEKQIAWKCINRYTPPKSTIQASRVVLEPFLKSYLTRELPAWQHHKQVFMKSKISLQHFC